MNHADPLGRLLHLLGRGPSQEEGHMGTYTASPSSVALDTGAVVSSPILIGAPEDEERVFCLPLQGGHDWVVISRTAPSTGTAMWLLTLSSGNAAMLRSTDGSFWVFDDIDDDPDTLGHNTIGSLAHHLTVQLYIDMSSGTAGRKVYRRTGEGGVFSGTLSYITQFGVLGRQVAALTYDLDAGRFIAAVNYSTQAAWSDDDGDTWNLVWTLAPSTVWRCAAADHEGNTILGGSNGVLAVSDDGGATWTDNGPGGSVAFYGLDYSKSLDRFVAVASGGEIYYSDDKGGSWTLATTGFALTNLGYDGNYFIATDVGSSQIRRSSDGISWTTISTPANFHHLTWDGEGNWAANTDAFEDPDWGRVYYSADNGSTWNSTDVFTQLRAGAIAYASDGQRPAYA